MFDIRIYTPYFSFTFNIYCSFTIDIINFYLLKPKALFQLIFLFKLTLFYLVFIWSSYQKSFYHQLSTNDLTQNVGMMISYDMKLVELGADYAFLWGNKTGHRFIPSLGRKISFQKSYIVIYNCLKLLN